eukprot:209160_1
MAAQEGSGVIQMQPVVAGTQPQPMVAGGAQPQTVYVVVQQGQQPPQQQYSQQQYSQQPQPVVMQGQQPRPVVMQTGQTQAYGQQAPHVVPQNQGEPKLCVDGCACCTMTGLIIFIVLFSIELLFVYAYDKNTDEGQLFGISEGHQFNLFIEFMEILYGLSIALTALFLLFFCLFRLWVRWQHEERNFWWFMFSCLVIWVVLLMIVTASYEGQNDAGLDFRTVITLFLLFTLCGPICLCCCTSLTLA